MREGEVNALMPAFESLKASYVAALESEEVTKSKWRSDKIKSVLLTCFGGMSTDEDIYQTVRKLEDQHRGVQELKVSEAEPKKSKKLVLTPEDFKKKADAITVYSHTGKSAKPVNKKIDNKALFDGNMKEAVVDTKSSELVSSEIDEDKKKALQDFADSKEEDLEKTYKSKGVIIQMVKGMIDVEIEDSGQTLREVIQEAQVLVGMYLEENA